ncbi:MAG: hypothetical protein CMC32_00650 [Flavobacteriaceae bacterium]|nr:hypothetical protein [Flavobacteriaceae bacterium]|tara:strand:+ start:46 stop:1380 length:1335 start_codon:yes stop_codon:yes gene_type:complete
MAKGRSYTPNTALIQGQRDVAQSQALANTAGGAAFAKGFTGAIVKGIEEQEKRDAIRESYLDDLQNPQNMRKIEDGYNKQAITEFLNNKKEAYSKAVDCYSKTKDRGCKEKMEEIKYSFSNLNSQLDMFLTDKKSYLDSFQNGQLVDLPGDEKYTELYTNNGGFNIEENGDLGMNVGGEYNKYNDVVGKWNVENNIYNTHILKSSFDSKTNGQAGKIFNRDIQKNSTSAVLKQTGYDGVMTATRSDFGFDDQYILPNGQKAGKMTFEHMFANGMLSDKYYDGSLTGVVYGKKNTDGKGWNLGEDGAKWFWDKNNSKDLTNLVAEYSTDVNETMHGQGVAQRQAVLQQQQQQKKNTPWYLQESQSKAKEVDAVVKGGITKESLSGITMSRSANREILENDDGTFTIWDAQGIPTDIDPKKPEEARRILYRLAEVKSIHKGKGKYD